MSVTTPSKLNFKKALLGGLVPEKPPQLGEEGKVVVRKNPQWDNYLKSLKEKFPLETHEEIARKKAESARLLSQAKELKEKITALEQQLKELKTKHQLVDGERYKFDLEIATSAQCASGKPIRLMTTIDDHCSGFRHPAEFKHGKLLYTMIVAHSSCEKSRNKALLELALLEMSSNPDLGDLYASAITNGGILKRYNEKKAKHLAERK
jgi:hypothetical protein